MEGIGLDNMMGAEEVEKLFSEPVTEAAEPNETEQESSESEEKQEVEETAEVDFSDLIQPESVGSEESSGGQRETPESSNDKGTPQTNLFSSIAKALRDEGVFPDLSDEIINGATDAAAFKKLFDDEVGRSLDERQQRLEKMLNSGATPDELKDYQRALNFSNFLSQKESYDTLVKEDEDGEKLRRQVMYQDYVNRGFSHERAVKLIQKSFDDGSDLDDAKEAFEACKEFYKNQVDNYQKGVEERQQRIKEDEQKQYSALKKRILDTESFYDGVKVDKATRQKAYEALTKATYKDEQGNYMTALQKYQRENPMEFMENVALMYSLTDGFKNVDKLTKNKVKAGLKKGFAELEGVLNSTRRNGDGTLNLANTAPDDEDREKWTLAL